MLDHGRKMGLTGEALRMFSFACYEVEFELEVNEMTGLATIIAVDGRMVAP